MRKKWFVLYSLLFFVFVGTEYVYAQHKFVIQTDYASSITIEDNDLDSTYLVPEFRKSSGGFLIECTNLDQTYLQNSSNRKVLFKLLWIDEGRSCKTIELNVGDRVSIAECIDKYQEDFVWTSLTNIYNRISVFINQARYGVVKKGKGAFLQGGKKEFYFLMEEAAFVDPTTIQLEWGGEELAKRICIHEKGSNKRLLKMSVSDKTTLRFNEFSSNSKSKFQAGKDYILEVQTKTKAGKKHIHQTTFSIFSKKEYEKINQFIEL